MSRGIYIVAGWNPEIRNRIQYYRISNTIEKWINTVIMVTILVPVTPVTPFTLPIRLGVVSRTCRLSQLMDLLVNHGLAEIPMLRVTMRT